MLDTPGQQVSANELTARRIARLLGAIQDMSKALQSHVNLAGELVTRQHDGTYVLSNFALSYDGEKFLEHRE